MSDEKFGTPEGKTFMASEKRTWTIRPAWNYHDLGPITVENEQLVPFVRQMLLERDIRSSVWMTNEIRNEYLMEEVQPRESSGE